MSILRFIWRYIWVAALVMSLAFLLADSIMRTNSIKQVTQSMVGNADPMDKDPNSVTGYKFGQNFLIMPALGTDGYHWLMQVDEMLKNGTFRERHADYDNPVFQQSTPAAIATSGNLALPSQAEFGGNSSAATAGATGGTYDYTSTPSGRDVHWSDSLHWLVIGVSWIDHKFTGIDLAYAIERDSQWVNTMCLAIVILVLTPLTAWRFGPLAASLLSIGFVAVYPYYEFSIVGYFDHHGLVSSANLMMVLFALASGCGWIRDENAKTDKLTPLEKSLWEWLPVRKTARNWMIASGIAGGGFGLWISAATVIPAMFGLGLAALCSTGLLAHGAKKTPWRTDPTLWRVWGLSAAGGSMFFYLLEYFPSYFHLRLEVNHPFYTMALLGAGDIMCRLSWLFQGSPVQENVKSVSAKDLRRAPAQMPQTQSLSMVTTGTADGGFLSKWLGQNDVAMSPKNQWLGIAIDLVMMSILPLTILFGGESVFVIRPDKFLMNLHVDYILEFRTLFKQLTLLTFPQVLAGISLLPLLSIILILMIFGTELPRPWKAVLIMCLMPGFVMLILAFSQIRWLGVDCALWLAALAGTTMVVSRIWQDYPWGKIYISFGALLGWQTFMVYVVIWHPEWWTFLAGLLSNTAVGDANKVLGNMFKLLCLAVIPAFVVGFVGLGAFNWKGSDFIRALCLSLYFNFLLLVILPFPAFTNLQWRMSNWTMPVSDLDVTQIITRDASQMVRGRLGSERGVIVSGPTTTTWMMYFGGFRGVGTLYWENVAGLKASAAIYSAPSPEKAKELVDKYGVTHIAIYGWDAFAEEYSRLSRDIRVNQQAPSDAFILKLLVTKSIPVWLRPIPYHLPQNANMQNSFVYIFEVTPDQTPQEAIVHIAQWLVAQSNDEGAINQLCHRQLLATNPDYLPGLAELALIEKKLGPQAFTTNVDHLITLANDQLKVDPNNPDLKLQVAYLQQNFGTGDAFETTLGQIIKNLGEAGTLKLEERLQVGLALSEGGKQDLARTQFEACLAMANEKSMRRLGNDLLSNLLQMAMAYKLTATYHENFDLGMSILPPTYRANLTSFQAGLALNDKDYAGALALFRKALTIKNGNDAATKNVIHLLSSAPDAAVRNGAEAVSLAKKFTDDLKFQSYADMDLLASAYAEDQKFDDAVFIETQAFTLASNENNPQIMTKIGDHLQLFKNHQPVHDDS